jgi:hypothetical protein
MFFFINITHISLLKMQHGILLDIQELTPIVQIWLLWSRFAS